MSRIRWIALALTVGLATPATAHPEDGRINDVYERLLQARSAHDVEGMAAAFAPEGLLVDQRPGPALAGSDLPARLRPMAARLVTDQVSITTAYRVERRSVMGDIAIDAGFMRQSLVRHDGQATTRYARFLVTMRRDADGGWRIIGDASMPATEEVWNGLTRVEGLQFDS